jgi:hypothetical protein
MFCDSFVGLSIMQHPTWLRKLNLRKLKVCAKSFGLVFHFPLICEYRGKCADGELSIIYFYVPCYVISVVHSTFCYIFLKLLLFL